MPTRFLIKKDWILRSHNFKKNTLFLLLSYTKDFVWYQFNTPGKNSGIVKIYKSDLKPLTEQEIIVKKYRQKIIQEHIDATSDPFTS